MARVVYRDENYQTYYVDVNDQQPEVTIGRNQGNMVLISAKSLSRYHAKIIYQNRRYFLIDLKSSNGSYVNNQRVAQQFEIHPGDKLRFGDVSVDFVEENRAIAPVNQVSVSAPPPISAHAMPAVPAVPVGGASKPPAPKLSSFNPSISAPSPDLRSVSMRPISSGGSYRPTMPNQPAFDDDMAKVVAEQSASGIGFGQNKLDASVAPRGFDPNSMGVKPIPVKPGLGDNVPPSLNPPAVGPASNSLSRNLMSPNAVPGISMDNSLAPSVAPVTFNPNSMGMIPAGPVVNAAPGLISVPNAGPASLPPSQFSQSSSSSNVSCISAPSMAGSSLVNGLPDSIGNFGERSGMPGMPGVPGNAAFSVSNGGAGIPSNPNVSLEVPEEEENEFRAEGTSVSSREAIGMVSDEVGRESPDDVAEQSVSEHSAESDDVASLVPAMRRAARDTDRSGRVASRGRVGYTPKNSDSQSFDAQNVSDGLGTVSSSEVDEGPKDQNVLQEQAFAEAVVVQEDAPEKVAVIESADADYGEPKKSGIESESGASVASEASVAPETAFVKQAENAGSVVASVNASEHLELQRQLEEAQERADDSAQTVELLNGAMEELKAHHASELADLNLEHLKELGKLRSEYEEKIASLTERCEELEHQNALANDELISVQAKLVKMESSGCAAMSFVPKWSARFDALVQYSKALERAVEKLGLDSVEPKAVEYVRSMGDMLKYCADEMKKTAEDGNKSE